MYIAGIAEIITSATRNALKQTSEPVMNSLFFVSVKLKIKTKSMIKDITTEQIREAQK